MFSSPLCRAFLRHPSSTPFGSIGATTPVPFLKLDFFMVRVAGAGMSKRPREVQVVVCPGPTFLSSSRPPRQENGAKGMEKGGKGKASDDRRGSVGGFGGKRKRETPEEQDLRQMWKDVIQLGTSTLQGYDRRSYEARKTVEMGGLAPKKQKVPYKILQGSRAKMKKKLAKQEQERKESGVVTAKVRGVAKDAKNERGKDRVRDPFPKVGKYKQGTLHLDRSVLSKLGKR